MNLRYILLFLISLIIQVGANSQELPRSYTLEQIIEIAQTQSPDALSAKNQFLKSFWEFRTSEAMLLPKLNFDAVMPNISRSIDKITLDDGSDIFIERSLANTAAEMSLSKNVGLTGGQVYLKSSLQRIDYLVDSTPTAYLSNPLILGYSQDIFSFNPYKWSKKIDPILYKEAKRRYLEDVEQISITATNYFFNLLVSQIQKKIALQKMANYDTLYKIAVGRYNLGKIPENDLLQLELQLLRAEAEVENLGIDFEDRMFKLKSYLRMKDNQPIELIPPVEGVRFFDIPVEKAIEFANVNNSKSLGFERRLLESDREVNRAQRENRFSATLFAQYGLTQQGEDFNTVYHNPQDQQQLSLGIHVPILDWGLAKGRIKIAESNREIQRTAVESPPSLPIPDVMGNHQRAAPADEVLQVKHVRRAVKFALIAREQNDIVSRGRRMPLIRDERHEPARAVTAVCLRHQAGKRQARLLQRRRVIAGHRRIVRRWIRPVAVHRERIDIKGVLGDLVGAFERALAVAHAVMIVQVGPQEPWSGVHRQGESLYTTP
jgi:outer membrane protein TolC